MKCHTRGPTIATPSQPPNHHLPPTTPPPPNNHTTRPLTATHHHHPFRHRDYQNIAVNGARSGAMNTTIQQGLSRSIKGDRPVVLMYALIGNDVCK